MKYSLRLLISLALGVVVFANVPVYANTSIGGTVNDPGADACPNIPGYQAAVPDGMEVDGSGDCYTPTPPPVDVCPNLTGLQETIPDGYFRDADGSCQPQPAPPAPPVDVCPNLSGVQATVPDGYIYDTNSGCVTPPRDVCTNIAGLQVFLPEGMVRDNAGVCSTPILVNPEDSSTNTDSEPSRTESRPTVLPRPSDSPATLSNEPRIESSIPVLESVGNVFPQEVRRAIHATPQVVARSFPYALFALIAATAAALFAVSLVELKAANALGLVFARQKRLAEQKDAFIMLVSHYLHTPLALLSNGLDTLVSLNEVNPTVVEPLRDDLGTFKTDVDNVINRVERNDALSGIRPPQEEPVKRIASSLLFMLPIILVVLLVFFGNFLFAVVGGIDLGTLNILTQIVILLSVIAILYTAVRNHQTRRRNRQMHEKLVDHENVIDQARTTFIAQITDILDRNLTQLDQHRSLVEQAPHAGFFAEGRKRFGEIQDRLHLLASIRSGSTQPTEPVNIRLLTDKAIAAVQATYPEKNVLVQNSLSDMTVQQDPKLFGFVLQSIIDNAVKFSNPGGTVVLSQTNDGHNAVISFIDTGVGVDAEHIEDLFQPFTRGTDTETFDYEGLGFSLFLDRIIMEYTGGDIKLESISGQGTRVTVTTPLNAPVQSQPATKAA